VKDPSSPFLNEPGGMMVNLERDRLGKKIDPIGGVVAQSQMGW